MAVFQQFCVLLEEVLVYNSHLFLDEEVEIFRAFNGVLSKPAKQLFVRLFNRTGPWFMMRGLEKYVEELGGPVDPVLTELEQQGFVVSRPSCTEPDTTSPSTHLHEACDLLVLLKLEDIVSILDDFRLITHSQKCSLKKGAAIELLRKHLQGFEVSFTASQVQSTIISNNKKRKWGKTSKVARTNTAPPAAAKKQRLLTDLFMKRSNTGPPQQHASTQHRNSRGSSGSNSSGGSATQTCMTQHFQQGDTEIQKATEKRSRLVAHVWEVLGKCVRLEERIVKAFSLANRVFYLDWEAVIDTSGMSPTAESNLLLLVLLNKVRFPSYSVSNESLFACRAELNAYCEAIQLRENFVGLLGKDVVLSASTSATSNLQHQNQTQNKQAKYFSGKPDPHNVVELLRLLRNVIAPKLAQKQCCSRIQPSQQTNCEPQTVEQADDDDDDIQCLGATPSSCKLDSRADTLVMSEITETQVVESMDMDTQQSQILDDSQSQRVVGLTETQSSTMVLSETVPQVSTTVVSQELCTTQSEVCGNTTTTLTCKTNKIENVSCIHLHEHQWEETGRSEPETLSVSVHEMDSSEKPRHHKSEISSNASDTCNDIVNNSTPICTKSSPPTPTTTTTTSTTTTTLTTTTSAPSTTTTGTTTTTSATKSATHNVVRITEDTAYLYRFCEEHIYLRCLSDGIEVLEGEKLYEEAVMFIRLLLDFPYFKPTKRGHWWNRMSLDLQHLKRKEAALEVVESCLKEHQERGIMKRSDVIALEKRQQRLHVPPRRWKTLAASSLYVNSLHPITHFTIHEKRVQTNSASSNMIKTLWVNPVDGSVGSVEHCVLGYFQQEGWDGCHCEGGILRAVYSLLLWDVIFETSVPHVFQTRFQNSPLDLGTPHFYETRKDKIDRAISNIENSTPEALCDILCTNYNLYNGICSLGVDWEKNNLDSLLSFLKYIGSHSLAGLLHDVAKFYNISGFPDLVMWNESTEKVKIVEVKSPNDTLSEKQMVWLHVLTENKVDASVCHVAIR